MAIGGYTQPTFAGMQSQGMGMPGEQEWIDYYRSLPPDQQEALRQSMARDFGAEQTALDEQMATAEALRDTATPEGRQAGRVYVAANPLEHIGAGLNRYAGQRDVKSLEGQMGGLRKGKQAMLADMMKGYGYQGGANSGNRDPFSLQNEFESLNSLKGY